MTTVVLRNPRREVQVVGGRRVKDILRELGVVPEAVLVIRGDELVTTDQLVREDETIELRPVMSGGQRQRSSFPAHPGPHPASPPRP
jgi:sulfur carrier protein